MQSQSDRGGPAERPVAAASSSSQPAAPLNQPPAPSHTPPATSTASSPLSPSNASQMASPPAIGLLRFHIDPPANSGEEGQQQPAFLPSAASPAHAAAAAAAVAVPRPAGVSISVASNASALPRVSNATTDSEAPSDRADADSPAHRDNANGSAAAASPLPAVPDTPPSQHALQRHRSFLDHDDNVRTVLVWQNLTVSSPMRGSNQRKVLLDNVSGSMTGGMWAVMGPSGCGKSTLLNTLACRLDVNTTVTGEMRLNGRPYQATELKKMSGYVMQDDLLNPNLTARETLHYTAALRLPASMSAAQRDARVEEVIQQMGLTGCQHVIVGDPTKKGISGGERRRVCIGMELLTRPTLLFLDEPTSGLDSVTALALIRLLHRITRSGKCSMLISIHQPQAKLFALFDRLLLLKSGRILFQGSVPAALKLFEECGFPVPHYSNPADHILDVITPPMDLTAKPQFEGSNSSGGSGSSGEGKGGRASPVSGEKDEERDGASVHERAATAGDAAGLDKALSFEQDQRMKKSLALEQQVAEIGGSSSSDVTAGVALTEFGGALSKPRRPDEANEALLMSKFEQPHVDLGFGDHKPLLLERENVSWSRQLKILILRNFRENMRRKNKLLVQAFQTIVIAVLIATVYLQIGTGQPSQIRRQPVLFFFCVNQGTFGALMVINSFPAERALMLRERAAGTYYASAYFVAKVLVDTLLTIPLPVIFTCITYFIVELQPTAAKFFLCMLLNTLCNLAATSLATMVCALCKTTELSVIVLPLIMELSRLFGGFYLAPSNLPVYFSWLDALSYIKYAYVGLSLNELEGLELTCTPKERLPSGLCPYPDGQKSIDNLGLDYISLGGCIGVLCGYVGFTWIVAFLAVRFIKSN